LENVGAWLFFLCEIFPLGNKKNGNSNPKKYIFGKNPTKLQKFWRKKTFNLPYLDNKFRQVRNTHKKNPIFIQLPLFFYNYILLSLLVEDLQPTLRKLRKKTPQTIMPLPSNLAVVVGLYQGSFKFEKEDGLGKGHHQHFHAR
jgi:hypothetical protein